MATIVGIQEGFFIVETGDGSTISVPFIRSRGEIELGMDVHLMLFNGFPYVLNKGIDVTPPPPLPPKVDTISNARKSIYSLLSFPLPLGALGIHKFYKGSYLAGLFYILIAPTGLSVLLSTFDFLIGLIKKTDTNGHITFK